MARDNTWTNPDGLVVGFGTHATDTGYLTVTSQKGNVYRGQMKIVGANLEDTDSVTAASPGLAPQAATIPRGSVITSAILQTVTAFDSAGDNGTLDIGTYDEDTSSITVDDADGIDVDIAQSAIDAVGEVVRCDGASVVHGDDTAPVAVGTTSDSDVKVVAAYQTAAFTAGEAILYLEWVQPVEGNTTLAV